MGRSNEVWKWDQAEQGPSHSPAEGLWALDQWHIFSMAQAAMENTDMIFPSSNAFLSRSA